MTPRQSRKSVRIATHSESEEENDQPSQTTMDMLKTAQDMVSSVGIFLPDSALFAFTDQRIYRASIVVKPNARLLRKTMRRRRRISQPASTRCFSPERMECKSKYLHEGLQVESYHYSSNVTFPSMKAGRRWRVFTLVGPGFLRPKLAPYHRAYFLHLD